MNRESIDNALATLVFGAFAFAFTSRSLVLPAECDAQPACFLRSIGDEYLTRDARGLPAKVVLHREIWLYAKITGDQVGSSVINELVDAIDTALKPKLAPGTNGEAQTLGGLVSHCWIEGEAEYDPGDIAGQAVAVIPVKILVPN